MTRWRRRSRIQGLYRRIQGQNLLQVRSRRSHCTSTLENPSSRASLSWRPSSLVIAHKLTHRAGALVKSATSAVRWVTLLATATPVAVAVAVVVVLAEAVVVASAAAAKLGTVDHQSPPIFVLKSLCLRLASLAAALDTLLATADRAPNVTTVLASYVHHTQVPRLLLKTHSRYRVTSVETATSLRNALATPVARKGLCIPIFFLFVNC
jgi:hypothetical protein